MITKEGTVAPVSCSQSNQSLGERESKQHLPPQTANTCCVSLRLLTEEKRSLRESRGPHQFRGTPTAYSSLLRGFFWKPSFTVSAESTRKEHYPQFFQPPLKPHAHPQLSALGIPSVWLPIP